MMQDIYKGIENIIKLELLLKSRNYKNILLVTGKQSFDNVKSIFEPYLNTVKIIRYSNFSENPKSEDIYKGINFYNHNKCEAIIAIGGGSVLDMAKLISAYHDVSKNLESWIKENRIGDSPCELIAIPTTAGTGSESTQFAVVYIDGIKYSVEHPHILPSLVFLIPELVFSMPEYLSAVTGVDALCQAIESLWSVNSTIESRNLSQQALKLIWNNLPQAVNKKDKEARENMLLASNLAGQAINITKTTGPHALSYGFTTYCNLPHGHAVALFLPFFVKLHMNINSSNCNDKRGEEWVLSIMHSIAGELSVEFENLPNKIADFLKLCNINIHFVDLNISENLFEKAIKGISYERLKNNPVSIDELTIKSIYHSDFNK
ncbi:phosphonoacetaldehyde reductase [Saccharicrinis sp. FJH2]|uniref:phosphonoacetaldehyde reductase n=1 Tax=Saccharicrinis sp. FJH65 TaxID=3344659 RepID=UPI0035F281EE